MFRVSVLVMLFAFAACSPTDGAPSAEARAAVPPEAVEQGAALVIDSAMSIPEAIRRFQAATEEPAPTRLTDGAASLEELLERLVRAYSDRDADALDRLAMTRAEFGYLYYPESPYPDRPYQLAPDFLWFLIEQNGARTVPRAVERLGGRDARVTEHHCSGDPKQEGSTLVWGPCFVTVRYGAGSVEELRIVNAVAERDGRFKVISLDGKL